MAQSILDDDGSSNASRNPTLADVLDKAIAQQPSRRRLLRLRRDAPRRSLRPWDSS